MKKETLACFPVNFAKFLRTPILKGSRTIAPVENCPPTLKLIPTLTKTLTLTGGQFSLVAIVRTPFEEHLQTTAPY